MSARPYICISVYMCMYVCAYIHMYRSLCVNVYMRRCTCVDMYMRRYVYVNKVENHNHRYVCMHACLCVYIYIYTYTPVVVLIYVEFKGVSAYPCTCINKPGCIHVYLQETCMVLFTGPPGHHFDLPPSLSRRVRTLW